MQVLVVSLLIVGKLPYFLIVCILGFLPKKVDVFCQKERFSASFCASFQHWPATAARHQCFQCIQALGKKKKTSSCGEPQQLEFLWQLGQAPREFLASRQWAHAFGSFGCGQDVTKLHSALRNFMQNPVSFPLPAKPTPAEMAPMWPKRRKMSYADACLF